MEQTALSEDKKIIIPEVVQSIPTATPATLLNILQEYFTCDPSTGSIYWKKKPNRNIPIGRKAGFLWECDGNTVNGRNQYIRLVVKGYWLLAHRVVFALTYGRFPNGDIDHINGNGRDNRICNLREVSRQENTKNQRISIMNKSGVMGVDYHPINGSVKKWRARIIVGQQERHLGMFNSCAEAVEVRRKAEREFGFHENHGRRI